MRVSYRLRFRSREIRCREAVELMTAYLDGALPARVDRRVSQHLAACPHCGEHLAQIRVTIDALGHVGPEHLSDEALEDLVAVFRRVQEG